MEKKISQAAQWALDNPEKVKEIQKNYYHRNKEKKNKERRHNQLKRKYGIGLDDYYIMLNAQQGQSFICGATEAEPNNPIRRFAVDHCHKTGKVRGLLCIKCNTGLGMFRDNIDLLISAISYLQEKS